MVEGDTQMSIEVENMADIEVGRMTGFEFGTVLGAEDEFAAVVLGVEAGKGIGMVAGVGFEIVPVAAVLGTVAGVEVEVGPETVNLTGFEYGVQLGTGSGTGIVGQFEVVLVPFAGNDIVAGLEAGLVSEAEPKEQHNYYTAAVPDCPRRFEKHKDIPG